MTRIEAVKSAVTLVAAAEKYGLKVSRGGTALCPFHDDRHPSLRLYEDHFYCFACAAHGDVIDLSAKLLDVPIPEAIYRLEEDFGIGVNDDRNRTNGSSHNRLSGFHEYELACLTVLTEYESLFRKWKADYAPKTPEEIPDGRFVEACQMLDYIGYLADLLCASESEERRMVTDDIIENGMIGKIIETLEEAKHYEKSA